MSSLKLRRAALAAVVAVGGIGFVAAAPAPTASAATCSHNVHTSDASPYYGTACWIDNGDKIQVCDRTPNDGVHAHADMWFDAGGFWYKFLSEDDGPDAGCDTAGTDLKGYNRVRLRVCAQRTDQTNFACRETIWFEQE